MLLKCYLEYYGSQSCGQCLIDLGFRNQKVTRSSESLEINGVLSILTLAMSNAFHFQ